MEKRKPRPEAAVCTSARTKSEVWNQGLKDRSDQVHIHIESPTAPFTMSIECIPLFPFICFKCMIRFQRALIRERI